MSQWYFKDRSNQTQGPFSDEEMRAWYEAGFLAADLPISKDARKGFKPLADVFPSSQVAFLPAADVRRMGTSGNEPGQWYFVDKSKQVQGPFSDIHMREWHMAGYFEPNLQIMNTAAPNAKWTVLRDAFPNLADAFLVRQSVRGPGGGLGGKGGSMTKLGANGRFNFPEWLPAPPRYKGVKKVYPSEKNAATGAKVHVAITDVHGRSVQTFQHARIGA